MEQIRGYLLNELVFRLCRNSSVKSDASLFKKYSSGARLSLGQVSSRDWRSNYSFRAISNFYCNSSQW